MSCNCEFQTNKEVLDKVIAKGITDEKMDYSYDLECECGQTFIMNTFATKCPKCGNFFAVTPCKSDDRNNIVMIKKED